MNETSTERQGKRRRRGIGSKERTRRNLRKRPDETEVSAATNAERRATARRRSPRAGQERGERQGFAKTQNYKQVPDRSHEPTNGIIDGKYDDGESDCATESKGEDQEPKTHHAEQQKGSEGARARWSRGFMRRASRPPSARRGPRRRAGERGQTRSKELTADTPQPGTETDFQALGAQEAPIRGAQRDPTQT